MSHNWTIEVVHSGVGTAQDHMQRDVDLLRGLTPQSPVFLHHYDWMGDSLTYGYFSNPEKLLRLDRVHREGIQMARRPTGGGLLFHLSDLAFSVLVPASHPWYSMNPLQNYAVINSAVLRTVARWLGRSAASIGLAPQEGSKGRGPFCMAHTTQYDLVLHGKKVGGAAQRRMSHGLLHQASLYLAPPPWDHLRDLLCNGDDIVAAMQRMSYPLLGEQVSAKALREARAELRTFLNNINYLCVPIPELPT
jgi:lipoate-protein ligase A